MSEHHDTGAIDWKTNGVKVIPGDQLDTNTPQTPGMNRAAAINFARVGAQKIWAGTVHIHANAKTGAHHHGALESVIYVLKGRARMRWGEHLEYVAEANPGDFIFIPPYVPHQEINASSDETLECVSGAQRQRGGRRQPRHRAGRKARRGALDRPDPQTRLSHRTRSSQARPILQIFRAGLSPRQSRERSTAGPWSLGAQGPALFRLSRKLRRGSARFAHCQAQAGQQQLAVLGVAPRQTLGTT